MYLKALAALSALVAPLCAQDAREIVKRSAQVDARNDRVIRNYTYRVLNETRTVDSAGKVRQTSSTLTEILYIGGVQYHHLLERNGKPLPAKEAHKEQARLDRAATDASKLPEAERLKREQDRDRRRAKDREERQSIPDAFDFAIAGEKKMGDRDVWEIRANPRRSYNGPHASVMRNIEGTLWIDKQDYEWVKVEADTLDTISLGLFLARIGKGTRLIFENSRLNGEVWAPKHVSMKASGRLGLLLKFRVDQELTFSDYRKFQTDSRMLPVE